MLSFVLKSVRGVLAQKKAWSAFASKYKLDIMRGKKMLDAIEVNGTLHGRGFRVYSFEDEASGRHTHIEVYLNTPPPAKLLLSKKPLPAALAELNLPEKLDILPQLNVAMTDDAQTLGAWFIASRIEALKNFMDAEQKNAEMLLIGDGDVAFMLWRSPDPLTDPRALNTLVQQLYACAKAIEG